MVGTYLTIFLKFKVCEKLHLFTFVLKKYCSQNRVKLEFRIFSFTFSEKDSPNEHNCKISEKLPIGNENNIFWNQYTKLILYLFMFYI